MARHLDPSLSRTDRRTDGPPRRPPPPPASTFKPCIMAVSSP